MSRIGEFGEEVIRRVGVVDGEIDKQMIALIAGVSLGVLAETIQSDETSKDVIVLLKEAYNASDDWKNLKSITTVRKKINEAIEMLK